MIYWFFTITFLFVVWIEYSVTNIFIRPDGTGKYTLNLLSGLKFMIHPLHNRMLWNMKTLDINYPFVLLLGIISYYLFSK
jgi:hypothetical protein